MKQFKSYSLNRQTDMNENITYPHTRVEIIIVPTATKKLLADLLKANIDISQNEVTDRHLIITKQQEHFQKLPNPQFND